MRQIDKMFIDEAPSLTVVKHCTRKENEAHRRFFSEVPVDMRPRNFSVVDDGVFAYSYMHDMRHPTTEEEFQRVIKRMESDVWVPTNRHLHPPTVRAYGEYIIERARSLRLGASVLGDLNTIFRDDLPERDIPSVEMVHGDFTRENILVNDTEVRLIDPGDPRGMYCREMDISKLMQSLVTDWEHLKKRGLQAIRFSVSNITRDGFSSLEYVLLLSHWIRLASHSERHSEEVLAVARSNIDRLTHYCL